MDNNNSDTQISITRDTLPLLLNTKENIEKYKQALRNKLEKNADNMVERYKKLPPFTIGYGDYAELLRETRELYIEGKYYSCITMCGITAERIAKDLLFTIITFEKNGKSEPASPGQLKQLDKIAVNIVRELLSQSDVIDAKVKTAFLEMANLRNTYAHGVGNEKYKDADDAIKYLHTIIDGTVSIHKYFEIKDGKYVEKNKTSANSA